LNNNFYKLNLLSCLGIVIGTVIGSGIFVVPSIMIKILPSPELLLLVWLFSAGISITGGLVIAGMGLAYPDARDLLDYYRILFPKWVVWIFNHMSIWVINIAGTVAVAFVFAEYLGYFLPLDEIANQIIEPFSAWLSTNESNKQQLELFGFILDIDGLGEKLAAIVLILLLGAMDMWNMKAADRFQIFFTAVKVGALLLLIGLLLIPGKGNMQNFEMSHTENWSTFKLIGAFVAACTGALNALDGWYMVSHITPEVKGGVKTVKKAIVWGLLICTGLYLLTAFAYQYILTPEEMGSTHLVAVKALEKELGGIAPMVIAALVLISTSSCVNANLIASSRLIASAADQKMMPAVFAKRNKKNIPIQAFILMLAMEIFFILTGSYEIFLEISVHAIWTFITMLTAGFLYVYITKKLDLPGFKRTPMIIACSVLILFGITYLINAFI
jgi:APA family basic amino acid/polyamine antiporter